MKRNILLFLITFLPLGLKAVPDPVRVTFTEIYKNGEPLEGAQIENVFPYLEVLVPFLQEHSIQSVVEVGCGDWQFSKYIDWEGINYTGFDIVQEIVDQNNEQFSAPNITFIRANCLITDLPSADLLICKDVLQHLSNNCVLLFLKQLPKYRYCLIINDIDSIPDNNNFPIQNGQYRPLDLKNYPFNVRGCSLFEYRSGQSYKQIYLTQNKQLS